MHRFVSPLFFLSLIAVLLGNPLIAAAQQQPIQQQTNAGASAQVRNRFNPNATLNSGSAFGGVTFSGVGGALAGCANIGGKIASGVSDLFKSQSKKAAENVLKKYNISVGGAGAQVVPVGDDSVKKKLEEANQRENCLNGVAYAVSKGMLQQVTNKTLNWVNTGLNGMPLYVRDIDSYMRSISNERLTYYLDKLPNQSPVFGNAIRSAIIKETTGSRDNLLDKAMNTPEGKAYQEFQNDFSNGGWQALLNPRNNPIGETFNIADIIDQDISTKQQNIKDELQRNGGFLDMKKCVEYEEPSTENQLDPTIYVLNEEPVCLRYETVTPGKVIADQVSQVTSSSIRQLEQADQINEVLGSFFDQLLNSLLSKGLGSLGGRNTGAYNFGGFGNNVVIGSNGQALVSSIGQTSLGYQTSDFDISRPQHMRSVLQAQYDYLNRVLDADAALNRIVPTLGALDYCIPGPNPTWKEEFDENVDVFFGSLQEVQEGSTFFGNLLQSIPLFGGLFGGGGSHAVGSENLELFDKITQQTLAISPVVFQEKRHSVEAITNDAEDRFEEILNAYETNFTKEAIENAFISVDSGNTAFVRGFIADTFDETSNLASYAQSSAEIGDYYITSTADVRDAIQELESINEEAKQIVATAKARYITEQAAAGTPVNLSCINDAYQISSAPIIPVARQESDMMSPFYEKSIEANNYFYNNL